MQEIKTKDLKPLEKKLGYTFKQKIFCFQALVHPSVGGENFQRLEFLGDRVLGLAIAFFLYQSFPLEVEGHLAKRFVEMVKKESLLKVGTGLELHKVMQMDTMPLKTGRVTADMCEALLGAVFLDGGFGAAFGVVKKLWAPFLDPDSAPPMDSKTALQEWLQGQKYPLPEYTTLEQEGPSHNPSFCVQVRLPNGQIFKAKGRSKREAQRHAASLALMSQRGEDQKT